MLETPIAPQPSPKRQGAPSAKVESRETDGRSADRVRDGDGKRDADGEFAALVDRDEARKTAASPDRSTSGAEGADGADRVAPGSDASAEVTSELRVEARLAARGGIEAGVDQTGATKPPLAAPDASQGAASGRRVAEVAATDRPTVANAVADARSPADPAKEPFVTPSQTGSKGASAEPSGRADIRGAVTTGATSTPTAETDGQDQVKSTAAANRQTRSDASATADAVGAAARLRSASATGGEPATLPSTHAAPNAAEEAAQKPPPLAAYQATSDANVRKAGETTASAIAAKVEVKTVNASDGRERTSPTPAASVDASPRDAIASTADKSAAYKTALSNQAFVATSFAATISPQMIDGVDPTAARAAEIGPALQLADAAANSISRPFSPQLGAAEAVSAASQIAAAIAKSSGDRIELRLDPPELGRVMVSLAVRDDAVIASVAAERPETDALLRRYGDELQKALREHGFEDVNLSFGGDGGDRDATDLNSERKPNADAANGAAHDQGRRRSSDLALDLRV